MRWMVVIAVPIVIFAVSSFGRFLFTLIIVMALFSFLILWAWFHMDWIQTGRLRRLAGKIKQRIWGEMLGKEREGGK